MVINSSFNGVKGFNLARHHYEAQFYFMNCSFSGNMADKSIEHVVPADSSGPVRPYFYGDRYYFYNCHRDAGDFHWFADNLNLWPSDITPKSLDAFRTFDYQWNPENDSVLRIVQYRLVENKLYLYFNELVAVRGKIFLETKSGKKYSYSSGSGRDILLFESDDKVNTNEINGKGEYLFLHGEIYAIEAGVKERKLPARLWINHKGV